MLLTQLETPVLVADADIIEQNMQKMSEILDGKVLKLRPHYKSHKCAAIAHKQIEMGAVGITCAKLSEAEDLVDSGVENVLIANQVVDTEKLVKLAALAKKCRLTVCVDDAENAKALSAAAVCAGAVVHVYIEYDIGMKRCGVTDPEKYVELAKLVVSLPGVEYDGIQAYAGNIAHEIPEEERASVTTENAAKLKALIDLLGKNGIKVNAVSGGSTGTSVIKAQQGVYTELQAGSYFFMDSTYGKLSNLPFKNSLFLMASVCSKRDGLTVLDAGVKSLGVEQDEPWVVKLDGTPVEFEKTEVNEEHLKLWNPVTDLAMGEKVLVIPGHCCSTVNLHNKIYLFRDGKIVDRLTVSARGCSR